MTGRSHQKVTTELGGPGGEAPPGGAWGLHPHKADETPQPALSAGMGTYVEWARRELNPHVLTDTRT
jgi:hypothetical protein